jgi:hypothetical protein
MHWAQAKDYYLSWVPVVKLPHKYYGLDVERPLQAHVFQGLAPSAAVLTGGAFGRWLDHESSNLINGLIHWWIRGLVGYWEVVEILRGGA